MKPEQFRTKNAPKKFIIRLLRALEVKFVLKETKKVLIIINTNLILLNVEERIRFNSGKRYMTSQEFKSFLVQKLT